MQIHKNQLVAINLMKESIFDLVKSSIAYILHFGNKSISSSEIIIYLTSRLILYLTGLLISYLAVHL